MTYPALPSTEAAVRAIRAVADEYGRALSTEHAVGVDQSSRRVGSGAFSTVDPDGSLPHEAYCELSGSPAVEVQVFSEGDAHLTVEGVAFPDVPREKVPAFLVSLYSGLAFVKGRFFPPAEWLVVPLPGDETYRAPITLRAFTPWLARSARSS